MKWILILSYLLSALFVTACTVPLQPQPQPQPQQVLTMPLQTIEEHPLTTQVRELNWQLLQQPFFVQGAFEHGQRLYISYPSSVITLPITHQELQRASAETLTQSRWFDMLILSVAEPDKNAVMAGNSYSLVISIINVENTPNSHMLTIELVNNRFNTVEAYVSRVILL
ncbi:penicillin-binding protein activator LpoB [Moritella sp. Urea-trap-13]|uniref:penicillin-binding protein activator LpoB n=1 Tax=Moritella sp. Urea-trap-13 TaxID=2058327 RepID=UPI000C31D4BE|nr:penicillin-binding protein activator LpoB [Moritella sp. Urea-trap-13]PKH07165.1 penicillin-binding protein activator LpoB [Moritella sp. Urea-trap-13]